MPRIPRADTTVSDTATKLAQGLDLICILAPCPQSADIKPRQFGSAAAAFAMHGYGEGIEYAALHVDETDNPFLFVALPIATPGVISREDSSGNTGSSAVTVTAGANGVLGEHSGIATVVQGGTVGTNQIVIGVSLDNGRFTKKIRFGIGNSYTDPYFGITIALGAGTLNTGEIVHTWKGSAPRSAAADWATAFDTLAKSQHAFRSMLLIGDLQDSTEAAAFRDLLNSYETAHQRYIYGRASVKDRLPLASMSKLTVAMLGAPNLTFADVGAADTITRSSGSWIADGVVAGDVITVAGSVSNNVTGPVASVTATVLTMTAATALVAEGPVAGCTVTASPGLTFAAGGHTITRSRGSWLTDGFRLGDSINVTGTISNNVTAAGVTIATALVLTLGIVALVNETHASATATITAGQTKAAWMAATDAAFASIDASDRIDLSAGRGRKISPFGDHWDLRRPAAWAASVREYQHDLQIPTWRKSDGSTGYDLFDTDQQLVEWDDRADGEAGSAARFTTFRTYSSDGAGAFIALSLTRATDGSLLAETHNVAVANLVQTIVQLNSENAGIGASLVLNDDGTATADSLNLIRKRVQDAIDKQVLSDRGEGPRASVCKFTPSPASILNVPDATLLTDTDLELDGTIHNLKNVVRVR